MRDLAGRRQVAVDRLVLQPELDRTLVGERCVEAALGAANLVGEQPRCREQVLELRVESGLKDGSSLLRVRCD